MAWFSDGQISKWRSLKQLTGHNHHSRAGARSHKAQTQAKAKAKAKAQAQAQAQCCPLAGQKPPRIRVRLPLRPNAGKAQSPKPKAQTPKPLQLSQLRIGKLIYL